MDTGPALAAAQRAAREQLRPTAAAAEAAMFKASGDQRLGSDSHPRDLARLCEDGFRSALRRAAMVYVSVKGRGGARQHVEDFRQAMQPIIGETLGVFDQNDGTGVIFQKPVAIRQRLDGNLQSALDDTVAGLAVGVFELPGQPDQGPVNIHFHGAATNVAIANSGSFVRTGDQTAVQTGLTVDDVLAALDQIETAVAASSMGQTEKEAAGDLVVNARRELQSQAPDAGRLKRFFSAIGDLSLKVGTSAAGGIIARFAAQWAGIV